MFYQTVKLMTPSRAGQHLLPASFVGITGSLGSGFIVKATGKAYWLTIFFGMFILAGNLLLSTWTENTPE